MLKIRIIRDVASRTAYHTGGAALEPDEKLATFLGRGAIFAGFRADAHPITAQALSLALHGIAADGSYMGLRRSLKRRAGWDVCLSPHKSISIAALCLNHDIATKVKAAWTGAVAAAVTAMESLACHGNGDGRKPTATGNLAVCAFTHFRSRHNDPQLHTHCLVLNATQSPNGQWRGLEPAPIYRCNMLLDSVLQRELARLLRAAGLDVDLDAKGRARLRAVPEPLCARFSTAKRLLDTAELEEAIPALASIRQRDARRDLINDRIRPPKTQPPNRLPALVPPAQKRAISRACVAPASRRKERPPAPPDTPELTRDVARAVRRVSLWPHTKAIFTALVNTSRAKHLLRLSFHALLNGIAWDKLHDSLQPRVSEAAVRRRKGSVERRKRVERTKARLRALRAKARRKRTRSALDHRKRYASRSKTITV